MFLKIYLHGIEASLPFTSIVEHISLARVLYKEIGDSRTVRNSSRQASHRRKPLSFRALCRQTS
ncbi:hypothetical protein AGR7A_pTi0044 [Agrobacterium deltaense NCPPB 1641]|uniref:Uncharacterized protein n=1 Tax=Agrobacterium deltaense NCPPB 1641 TaxID=1183425 RepID=A0A1S7UBZ8_9HYPH|nr:hypothetical protein AGR7A_pTi0044 [Agrobacterium deltaense NCPPB 1641]